MPLQSFSGILCFPNFCLFSTYVKRIPQHIKHHVRCRRTFQSINRKLKQINRIWTDGPRRFLEANMIFNVPQVCYLLYYWVTSLKALWGELCGHFLNFWHWHVNRWRFREVVSRACVGATRNSAGGVFASRAAAGMTRRERDGYTSANGRALYYTTQSNVRRDKVHSFFAMQLDFILFFYWSLGYTKL